MFVPVGCLIATKDVQSSPEEEVAEGWTAQVGSYFSRMTEWMGDWSKVENAFGRSFSAASFNTRIADIDTAGDKEKVALFKDLNKIWVNFALNGTAKDYFSSMQDVSVRRAVNSLEVATPISQEASYLSALANEEYAYFYATYADKETIDMDAQGKVKLDVAVSKHKELFADFNSKRDAAGYGRTNAAWVMRDDARRGAFANDATWDSARLAIYNHASGPQTAGKPEVRKTPMEPRKEGKTHETAEKDVKVLVNSSINITMSPSFPPPPGSALWSSTSEPDKDVEAPEAETIPTDEASSELRQHKSEESEEAFRQALKTAFFDVNNAALPTGRSAEDHMPIHAISRETYEFAGKPAAALEDIARAIYGMTIQKSAASAMWPNELRKMIEEDCKQRSDEYVTMLKSAIKESQSLDALTVIMSRHMQFANEFASNAASDLTSRAGGLVTDNVTSDIKEMLKPDEIRRAASSKLLEFIRKSDINHISEWLRNYHDVEEMLITAGITHGTSSSANEALIEEAFPYHHSTSDYDDIHADIENDYAVGAGDYIPHAIQDQMKNSEERLNNVKKLLVKAAQKPPGKLKKLFSLAPVDVSDVMTEPAQTHTPSVTPNTMPRGDIGIHDVTDSIRALSAEIKYPDALMLTKKRTGPKYGTKITSLEDELKHLYITVDIKAQSSLIKERICVTLTVFKELDGDKYPLNAYAGALEGYLTTDFPNDIPLEKLNKVLAKRTSWKGFKDIIVQALVSKNKNFLFSAELCDTDAFTRSVEISSHELAQFLKKDVEFWPSRLFDNEILGMTFEERAQHIFELDAEFST